MVKGKVLAVSKKWKSGKNYTMIEARFFFPGPQEKTETLALSAIRPGSPPLDEEPNVPPGYAAIPRHESSFDEESDSSSNGTQNLNPGLTSLHSLDDSDSSEVAEYDSTSSDPSTLSFDDAVVTVGEVQWHLVPEVDQPKSIGEPTPRDWSFRHPYLDGVVLEGRCDGNRIYTALHYFQVMMPKEQLRDMIDLTNLQLRQLQDETSNVDQRELLKFIGVLLLGTRFEFGHRRNLWSEDPLSRFVEAPAFGRKTGMSRDRFEQIWGNLRFSYQPAEQPAGMTSEQYRWMLVDGFVARFNQHRVKYFIPSSTLCVDESICRWYGHGGTWINRGLPMYIAMDRKPESGGEIQDCACGQSGIMVQLLLVKSKEERAREDVEGPNEEGVIHGAKVLNRLVEPWHHTQRLVCADSFFASVGTAVMLKKNGLLFTGVVKTATKNFPTAWFQSLETDGTAGTQAAVRAQVEGVDMVACMWTDRNRRYFISTAGRLSRGPDIERDRLRQVVDEEDAPPELVHTNTPQSWLTHRYYDSCAMIDRHNRIRQADLMLERKYKTWDWARRMNFTILGMIVTDAYLLMKHCQQKINAPDITPREFVEVLAAQLIDNEEMERRGAADDPQPVAAQIPSGVGPHITPTKQKKRKAPTHTAQRRCVICGVRVTTVCSECRTGPNNTKEVFICRPNTQRNCWAIHVNNEHRI